MANALMNLNDLNDLIAHTGQHCSEPLPMVQLVEPDGRLTELANIIGIDTDLARTMYRDMVLGRRFDFEALALQRQGQLGLWLMCWGQEAAQVGSVRALRANDMIFPSYREHLVALARGISPTQLLTQWRGIRHSGWNPREHAMHMYGLVLGHQTLYATGYATGVRLDDADEIVVAYFGDGATSQGDVSEALNWSATASLPVLFFCQNNQWAISTPTRLQMHTPFHCRAQGFGVRSYYVDGNDALAVHTVTSLAARYVRDGCGPALVEAYTYRMAGHSTSDDPTRYRQDDDTELWKLRDPISRLDTVLRQHDTPEEWFNSVHEEAADFAAQTRQACASLAPEDLADMFDWVYVEQHPLMDAQKKAYHHARNDEGAL